MKSDRQFSDPIFWPTDAPLPLGVSKIILVSRKAYNDAEMAAMDELPSSLRKLLQQHNINMCAQLIEKGLHFGEFTEDQVYLEILKRVQPTLLRA